MSALRGKADMPRPRRRINLTRLTPSGHRGGRREKAVSRSWPKGLCERIPRRCNGTTTLQERFRSAMDLFSISITR